MPNHVTKICSKVQECNFTNYSVTLTNDFLITESSWFRSVFDSAFQQNVLIATIVQTSLVNQTAPSRSAALDVMQYIQVCGGSDLVHENMCKQRDREK